jgi:hypothetical protein
MGEDIWISEQALTSTTSGVVTKEAGGKKFYLGYFLQMPCQPTHAAEGFENAMEHWDDAPILVLSIQVNLIYPPTIFWPSILPLQGSNCSCKSWVGNAKMVLDKYSPEDAF